MIRVKKLKEIIAAGGGRSWAVLALAASAWCAGCDDGRDQIRSYTVPKEQPPPAGLASSPPVSLPSGTMQWDVPDGWTSIPNTNSMRFATLSAGEGSNRIEIAITQLTDHIA